MVDVKPMSRRPSHIQLAREASPEKIVYYIQREIMEELRTIRSYLDVLGPCFTALQADVAALQSASTYSVSFGDNIHASQPVPGAAYTHLALYSLFSFDQRVRVTFDAGASPALLGELARAVYLEFWSGATSAGGSPEIALFNDDVPEEVAGTATIHALGTTTQYNLVGPLTVGDAAGELPAVETKYSLRGRDTTVTTTPLIEQARFLVRYE